MKKFLILVFIYTISSSAIFAQAEDQCGSLETFVSVKGTAISSIGHFKDAWEKGTAFYVSYGKVYSSHWSLIFQTGYNSFKENPEYAFQGNAKFSIIPLQIGGRYYILLDRVRPFVLAMSGINIVKQKFDTYVQDEHISIDKVDKTTAHVNFQIGVGLGIKIIDQLELEFLGKYNSHMLEPSVPYNATGLEFGAGINWVFPGN